MRFAAWLDPWLYRRPFTGRSATRYSHLERPGFGDLDDRLCAAWRPDLAAARHVADIGAGPGTVGRALRTAFPGIQVIDVEPSGDFAPDPGAARRIRARAEALPLASASIDAAVSVSAIRHVADRVRALAELRRVVRPGGVAFIVELDPDAPAARVRAHVERLGSFDRSAEPGTARPISCLTRAASQARLMVLRAAFAPLVLRTAPPAETIARAARIAGWRDVSRRDDPVQPVYELRLA